MDLLKHIEAEAIEVFGADKIGTKELRIAMSNDEKNILLSWLINRYYEYTGGFSVFF